MTESGRKRKRTKERMDLIHEAADLMPMGLVTTGEACDLAQDIVKRVRKECAVAKAQFQKKGHQFDGPDSTRMMTTHQKMKIALDFFATTWAQPEIQEKFVERVLEKDNVIQFAKLMASMMPKELNVEVTQQKGVILVPMRLDDPDEWEKQAQKQIDSHIIEAEPLEIKHVQEWEDLVYGAPKPDGIVVNPDGGGDRNP